MRVAGDGLAHARFVAEFFSGPVNGYSASSSDNGVATAGIQSPDLLIVAPVSSGTASVTVMASGPGGTATQTFTVRVGTGSDQTRFADAAAAAPAPAPAPPAAQQAEVFVPSEELPPEAPIAPAPPPEDAVEDTGPVELLPAVPVTEAPTLSGSVPEQSVIVGQSKTVDVNSYFGGVVQGWAVESSAPTNVPVSMTVAGVVTFDGGAIGTSTVTVTASNDIGSVAQSFQVTVTTNSGNTNSGNTGSSGILTTVGSSPRVTVAVGQTTTLDLSQYFSTAATGFDVDYDETDSNRLVDVTMDGPVATIQGLRVGNTTIDLLASSPSARIERTATIQVTN